MKKITIASLAIIMALVGASSAQAETRATTTPMLKKEVRAELNTAIKEKRDEIRNIASTTKAVIKDKKVELKNEIEQKKQELKTERNERASTTAEIKLMRVAETVKLSQTHLNNEIARLNDAKSRIDSRLTKFEQVGGNTTLARADLALAVTAMTAAQAKVDAVGTVKTSTDTKAFADALRTAVKAAQSSINDAQKALSKVTSDMKGIESSIKRNNRNATSTASSTQN